MSPRPGLRAATATLLASLALAASPARAHVIPDPRVLVIVVTPAGLEIRVNDMGQPGDDSASTRRRFDVNRDGKLDDSERSDLASFLVARATGNLRVSQDGKVLALKERSRALHGVEKGIEASDAISIDVVLDATPQAAKDGTVSATIGDWRADGHAVRAAVLAQGGAVLRKSTLGSLEPADAATVATGISLDRDQTVTLTWR
ncbi:MAG TPA: hypothetical protein VMV18_11635 [bacterium]|nr:hypothetical protein [bacterium]